MSWKRPFELSLDHATATLREVIQARNYVTRTVLNVAGAIYTLLGICAAVGAEFYVRSWPNTPKWQGIVALAVVLCVVYYSRPKPSKDLILSEEVCSEP